VRWRRLEMKDRGIEILFTVLVLGRYGTACEEDSIDWAVPTYKNLVKTVLFSTIILGLTAW
jgi:hypothetical protein